MWFVFIMAIQYYQNNMKSTYKLTYKVANDHIIVPFNVLIRNSTKVELGNKGNELYYSIF